jgi:hypothetical protein
MHVNALGCVCGPQDECKSNGDARGGTRAASNFASSSRDRLGAWARPSWDEKKSAVGAWAQLGKDAGNNLVSCASKLSHHVNVQPCECLRSITPWIH